VAQVNLRRSGAALVAAMLFGFARAMERRGESGGGVQVGFKPMTLHCLSSSPAGSADFSGCYPLLSPTSFNWQLQSDGATGGLAAGMECEQQQFEDFFSSPEKIGAGAEEKERGVTVPAVKRGLSLRLVLFSLVDPYL
jgi:hypothetical protein